MQRFVRYSGVSLVAFALAQLGLAIAYGLGNWPVVPAVLFSLAVSAIPAYLLSRVIVWPDGGHDRANTVEGSWFLLIALVGSLLTAGFVTLAESLARRHTADHATLTVIVNLSSIVATAAIWLARFTVLDRLVFRRRRPRTDPALVIPADAERAR